MRISTFIPIIVVMICNTSAAFGVGVTLSDVHGAVVAFQHPGGDGFPVDYQFHEQSGFADETHEFGMISGGYNLAWATKDSLGYVNIGQPGFYVGARAHANVERNLNGEAISGYLCTELLYDLRAAFYSDFARMQFSSVGGTQVDPATNSGALHFAYAQSNSENVGAAAIFTGSSTVILTESGIGSAAIGTNSIRLTYNSEVSDKVEYGGGEIPGFPKYGYPNSAHGELSQILIWGIDSLPGQVPINPLDFQGGSNTRRGTPPGTDPPLGTVNVPVSSGYGGSSFVYVQGLASNPSTSSVLDTATARLLAGDAYETLVFSSLDGNLSHFIIAEPVTFTELFIAFDGQRHSITPGLPFDFTQYLGGGVNGFSLEVPESQYASFLDATFGFQFLADGFNTVVVTSGAVPEPSSVLLLLAAVGSFVVYKKGSRARQIASNC